MTIENGNGEVKQLLEIRRAYRRDLTSLEEELRVKFERELADGRKRLREQYLENVVDTVFAEPAPPTLIELEAKEATIAVKPEVKLDVEVKTPGICPECAAKVGPDDKFCSKCAYPLQEDLKDDAPVVSQGRRFRTRVRR